MSDLAKAVADYNEVIRLDPNNAEARNEARKFRERLNGNEPGEKLSNSRRHSTFHSSLSHGLNTATNSAGVPASISRSQTALSFTKRASEPMQTR